MISRFLRKAKPIKLGRWTVNNDIKVQEQRINWANHDHCGSEICEKKITKEKKVKKVNIEPFDKMLPFCI